MLVFITTHSGPVGQIHEMIECWRSRIRCYGPTSHRKEGREVREGEAPMAKVGIMSSGTCTCEARAECVRSQDA